MRGTRPHRRPTEAGLRIRDAFDLYAFGEDVMRARLRHQHPGLSAREIERHLTAWLRDRPADAPGRERQRGSLMKSVGARGASSAIAVVLVALGAAAPAAADGDAFASGGVTISFGSRGFALGVEISGGFANGPYAGAALGVDVAAWRTTWGGAPGRSRPAVRRLSAMDAVVPALAPDPAAPRPDAGLRAAHRVARPGRAGSTDRRSPVPPTQESELHRA